MYIKNFLDNTRAKLFTQSAKTIASLSSTNSKLIIQQIVKENYIYKVTQIMFGTDTHLIKKCLWGLSNIVLE